MTDKFVESGYVWAPYVPMVLTPTDVWTEWTEPKFSIRDYLYRPDYNERVKRHHPLDVLRWNSPQYEDKKINKDYYGTVTVH